MVNNNFKAKENLQRKFVQDTNAIHLREVSLTVLGNP